MEYNTERKSLIIPEYGRYIHQMVDYCKTLNSKEERNEMALAIIEVMGNLNPHLRDINDFQHKLWDQLFIMAQFDLDVDSPYPIPNAEDFQSRPNVIPYPKVNNKYKYYGQNTQKMIDVALSWEEGDKRFGLAKAIANHMKKSYLLWNKDNVDDQVIINHLKDMSAGKIDIENEEEISLASSKDLTNSKIRNSNNNNNNAQNKRRFKKRN